MHTLHRRIRAWCPIALSVTIGVPAFAQTDNQPRADTARTLALAHGSAVMRAYARTTDADEPRAELPPNFLFAEMYRGPVESMLRHSRTFRRQCRRLALAPNVTVRLDTQVPTERTISRAHTVISRTTHGFVARMRIKPTADLVELIAHEIEHIIEQIDGVDLFAHAARPHSGVREIGDASFETVRAIRIGELVAREVRARR